MKNIRFDPYLGPRLPRQVQLNRIHQVIQQELTDLQRQALVEYLAGKTVTQIARERQVNKSTVSRTLHRAMEKVAKLLRY